jgi:hypothetical protein
MNASINNGFPNPNMNNAMKHASSLPHSAPRAGSCNGLQSKSNFIAVWRAAPRGVEQSDIKALCNPVAAFRMMGGEEGMMMKNMLIIAVGLVIITTSLHATIGNPWMLDSLYYLPTTQEIKIVRNYGGDGSIAMDAPTAYTYSMTNGSLMLSKASTGFSEDELKNGIPLKGVNLSKLGMRFTAKFEKLGSHYQKAMKTSSTLSDRNRGRGLLQWRISPFVHGESKKSFLVPSCAFDGDAYFRGYSYPGARFVILVVTTRNVYTPREPVYPDDSPAAVGVTPVSDDVFVESIPGYVRGRPPPSDRSESLQAEIAEFEKLGYVVFMEGGIILPLHIADEARRMQLSRDLNTWGFRVYKKGDLRGALFLFDMACDASTDNLKAIYNLACAQARDRNSAGACENLKMVLKHKDQRKKYLDKIQRDTDFDAIRESGDYQALISAGRE